MPDHPQHRKINPLAIIAVILILLALGMLFLIFAPGPRMKWALTMGEKYLTDCEYRRQPWCGHDRSRSPADRDRCDRRSRGHPGCGDTRRDKDSFAANQN